MKVKLLIDLPIDKKHGAVKGKVFDLLRIEGVGNRRKYFFIGGAGEECAAFRYEAVLDAKLK
jgi:hypothetical protein